SGRHHSRGVVGAAGGGRGGGWRVWHPPSRGGTRRRRRPKARAPGSHRPSEARESPRGRRARVYSGSTFTDLIVTGSTGTFWCGPLVVVGTFSIFRTTSIPSTTLPNTA